MPEETAKNVGLTEENKMRRQTNSMIDKVQADMGDKFNNLRKLDYSFGFFHT